MGLLPDLDSNGHLIPEKKVYHMPRTTKKFKTFLSWENLLLNRCPNCGELFPQTGEQDRVCENHSGGAFKIPYQRFKEICRDIENKEGDGGWIKNI